jgi:uncharacterized protein YndB with AHSA1/START domain
MILQLFKKKRELIFERSYAAPIATVWDAWTRPEMLREWWGPEHTTVTDCEVDLRTRLAYDARSWTEGEEETSTIEHVNELTLSEDGDTTVVNLRITIRGSLICTGETYEHT